MKKNFIYTLYLLFHSNRFTKYFNYLLGNHSIQNSDQLEENEINNEIEENYVLNDNYSNIGNKEQDYEDPKIDNY